MKHIKNKIRSSKNRLSRFFWLFCCLMLILCFGFFLLLNHSSVVTHFSYSKSIPAPEVDIQSSYSVNPISVSILNLNKKYKVYYTLDGSSPSSSAAQLYDGVPISIVETIQKDTFLYGIPTSPRWQQPLVKPFCYTIFRAVFVDDKGQRGEECIKSYIIDPSQKNHYAVPIASIVFNPDDFFGYKNGIYVMGKTYEDKTNYIKKRIRFDIPWWRYPANYLDKGASSDRPVSIEFIDLNTNCVDKQNTQIRIHGFNTRGFAQKSLRFKYYAETSEEKCLQIFDGLKSEQNYVLRNGGNDWTGTLLRDAFVHEIMKNSTLSAQAYQPVVCFFNGEYWGVHTLRERFDGNYIENKYGISKDSIAILELDGHLLEGGKSDVTAYKNLINFIQTSDMSQKANYAIVEKELDVENLIDYYLTNLFFVNNDWPHNNCKYWRYAYPTADSLYRDAKWRYVLYDMDWAMGFNIKNAYNVNMFDYLKGQSTMGKFLFKLIKNEEFKQLFENRAYLFLGNNYKSENLLKVLSELELDIEPLMNEQIDRWRVIGSKNNWSKNIEELKVFMQKRPSYFKKDLDLFLKNN